MPDTSKVLKWKPVFPLLQITAFGSFPLIFIHLPSWVTTRMKCYYLCLVPILQCTPLILLLTIRLFYSMIYSPLNSLDKEINCIIYCSLDLIKKSEASLQNPKMPFSFVNIHVG